MDRQTQNREGHLGVWNLDTCSPTPIQAAVGSRVPTCSGRCPSGQPSASPCRPQDLLPHPQHMATAACFFVCLAVLPHSAQPPPSVQLASASSLVFALLTVRSHHQPPFPLCSLPISPCPLPPPLSEAHQWQLISATSSLGAPSPSQSVSHPCPWQGGHTCPFPSPSTTWSHPFIHFFTHSSLSPPPRSPPLTLGIPRAQLSLE